VVPKRPVIPLHCRCPDRIAPLMDSQKNSSALKLSCEKLPIELASPVRRQIGFVFTACGRNHVYRGLGQQTFHPPPVNRPGIGRREKARLRPFPASSLEFHMQDCRDEAETGRASSSLSQKCPFHDFSNGCCQFILLATRNVTLASSFAGLIFGRSTFLGGKWHHQIDSAALGRQS
jgi:hypothetical protein